MMNQEDLKKYLFTSLTQEEFDKLPRISQEEIQELLDKGKEEADRLLYGKQINGVQYFT